MSRRKRVLLWAGVLVALAGAGLVGVRLATAPAPVSYIEGSVPSVSYHGASDLPESPLDRLRRWLGL